MVNYLGQCVAIVECLRTYRADALRNGYSLKVAASIESLVADALKIFGKNNLVNGGYVLESICGNRSTISKLNCLERRRKRTEDVREAIGWIIAIFSCKGKRDLFK